MLVEALVGLVETVFHGRNTNAAHEKIITTNSVLVLPLQV